MEIPLIKPIIEAGKTPKKPAANCHGIANKRNKINLLDPSKRAEIISGNALLKEIPPRTMENGTKNART